MKYIVSFRIEIDSKKEITQEELEEIFFENQVGNIDGRISKQELIVEEE